jgi:hypothetical protein
MRVGMRRCMRGAIENVAYVALAALTVACSSSNDVDIVPDAGADSGPDLFAIGGTVNGLAGTGLVLENGGEELPISSNGPFTFAKRVTAGGAFRIAVKTQPSSPPQVCTVSGGDGSVVAGDARAAVVNCSTSTFTLGGTVSGLAGAGLVLQNNGGDDLAIGANGTFAFGKPVSAGSPYAVTVKAKPGLPTQTCAVSNGTGTMPGANVSSVGIACTTDQFVVGVDVTGLTSGSVVLTNMSGSDLTAKASGAYDFPTKVSSGAEYKVVVKSHPEGQYCKITSGTGKVGAADVRIAVACIPAPSCKAILTFDPTAPSAVFSLAGASGAYGAFCDMKSLGGGWTLAMKGSATSSVFAYASTHWTTTSTLSPDPNDRTPSDAKFASFNEVPFTDAWISTANASGQGSIVVPNPTPNTTLLSRFQGANYQLVSPPLGRNAWVASQAGTTLQVNCNREGFNLNSANVKARIGLEANEQNDCGSSDSVVGIGLAVNPSCGNDLIVSAGYHTGRGCGGHAPIVPTSSGAAASFYLWVR